MAGKRKTTKIAATAADETALTTGSTEQTQELGEALGKLLHGGDVIALHGELGSGKTTLIQGIARGLGAAPELVKSPTFVLMREYPGRTPLVHLDAYRLEGTPSIAWIDMDLMFSPEKVTVIEWAERFGDLLPQPCLTVTLSHLSAHRRRLAIVPGGSRAESLRQQLQGLHAMTQQQTEPSDSGDEPNQPEEGTDADSGH